MNVNDFNPQITRISEKMLELKHRRERLRDFLNEIIIRLIDNMPSGMDLPHGYMVVEELGNPVMGNPGRKFLAKMMEGGYGYTIIGGRNVTFNHYPSAIEFLGELQSGWMSEVIIHLNRELIQSTHQEEQLAGIILTPEAEEVDQLNKMLGSGALNL